MIPPVTVPKYPHCSTKRSEEMVKSKDGSMVTEVTNAETKASEPHVRPRCGGPGFFNSSTDRTNLVVVIAFHCRPLQWWQAEPTKREPDPAMRSRRGRGHRREHADVALQCSTVAVGLAHQPRRSPRVRRLARPRQGSLSDYALFRGRSAADAHRRRPYTGGKPG